ncbi:hypothetical protein BO86DRAFT_383541 [Aspergillus japonicus CBS 114.51]|uniref:Uncharacterized protein n=1 Tax=Aspergillus japonicus CBS 114.51 TaxID=1448312 RepID=A0A8T8WMA3_ASPJA|nr:hypothetical protein BO86DRAFT_383541 [Aspergillus japonicus CBS 114.51]RAH76772.1 hypothetical protein BO86DRAFT_383541 [Aspergillus japonicus CBS 114.51]
MECVQYSMLGLSVLSTEAPAAIPISWTVASAIPNVVLANMYGRGNTGVIVAGLHGAIHIIDTIDDCMDAAESGTRKDALTCAVSLLTGAAVFGLAVENYRLTGAFTNKRELEGDFSHLDRCFSQLGDGASVWDIHYEGIPLNATHLPQTLQKRGSGDDTPAGVRALHNSSMPLSFIYESTRKDYVPLLVATNGTHYHIGHLAPVGGTTAGEESASLRRRTDIAPGVTHVGAGGVKVQCNSKGPVMTEQQVQLFMDEPMGTTSSSAALSVFLSVVNYATFTGFSFNEWVDSDLSGQWAMEAETAEFGSNWETNWNWCFGVEENYCDKGL